MIVSDRAHVAIVGLGPAGIGAALTLAKSNRATRVLCLDAGNRPSMRSCSVVHDNYCKKEEPCQVVSGFGGCSLLSGGKVSAFPAGSALANILGSKALAERATSKAIDLFGSYVALKKPKIGSVDIRVATDLYKELGFEYKYYDAYVYSQGELREAYERIFGELKSSGMSLLLNTELIEVDRVEDGYKLTARRGDERLSISTKYIVLGLGRLGRTFLKSLNAKFNLDGKVNHLDVGVRLEFPKDICPDLTKYHNDLKLLFDSARTFCVCSDGKVAPYLLEDVFFTEGYYNPEYGSGFTNLGILIRLPPSRANERILEEIRKRCQRISKANLIYQRLSDYLANNCEKSEFPKMLNSSISFGVGADINQCFPEPVSGKIREAVYYFVSRLLPEDEWGEVNVFAPEVDYGGVCFPINSDFSIIPRMYLVGDCTGRFRGILQGFCSGIICGESIACGANENEKEV